MSAVASVVEDLIIAAVFSEKTAVPRKNKTDWALAALSVLLAGAGVLFAILALDRYLESIYTPTLAALACTGALFVAALVPVFTAYCLRKRRPAQSARHPLADNLRVIIEAVCVELEEPIRQNPKAAVLAASLAGFFSANHHMRS